MQNLLSQNLLSFWKTVRRPPSSAKRDREPAAEEGSGLQTPLPQKRLKLEDASGTPPDAGRTLCCLQQLSSRGTPQGLVSGLPERQAASYAADDNSSSPTPSKRRLELISLPVDVLRIIAQQLSTADRKALRQASRVLCDSVSFGGIRLAYPMAPGKRRLIPALARRPALHQLKFVQCDDRPLRKRDFKTLLGRLGTAPANRRYTVQISVSAKVTTADMQWLEQHLGARGFTPHLARVTMDCHLADFESAFPTVPGLHVRARRLSERAHLAATRGRLHNLEELHISGLRDENDVQMAWIIADRSVSPALRSLLLSAERGVNIPVGCRRQHPDFSHLTRLGISRDIYLCINFMAHLLPLRAKGLQCWLGLGDVLDEYTAKKLVGQLHLPLGTEEADQHGFLGPFAA